MDCLIVPISILMRCYTAASPLAYRPLLENVHEMSDETPVTVVVGKERRKFLVDPYVLEENPFRVLIDIVKKKSIGRCNNLEGDKRVIFVDVDAILFEHMLWLMKNDCSSFFKLNLIEIVDFYAQDN